MTAQLSPEGHALLNLGFAEHFDGRAPATIKAQFGLAGNLQNVAEQLSYTGPQTPAF